MITRPGNSNTVAWLLSTKARLDPPGRDTTSTYLQDWARLMTAQMTWQNDSRDNYDKWLEAACRAAVYEGSAGWACAELVNSTDSLAKLIPKPDMDLPKSLATIGTSTSSGETSYLKLAHGALQIACERGNLEAVKLLVSGGIDPALHHPVFGWPIYNAVRNGHLDVLKFLLESGTSLNTQSGLFAHMLELAAKQGHSLVFRYLLDKSPGENAESLHRYLFIACQNGHESAVRALFQWIDIKTTLYNRSKSWVDRVMFRRPSTKIAALNPNEQMEGGQTPLCVAVRHRHTPIVEILIARREFNPGEPNDRTCPLWVATQTDQGEVIKVLLARYRLKNKITSKKLMKLLNQACKFGNASAAELLLEQPGVDPNTRATAADSTPLVTAIDQTSSSNDSGRLQLVRQLLAHRDIDPNLPRIGLKPLEVAIRRNDVAVVELLLGHPQTDPNLHNDEFTPLCSAIRKLNLRIVELILKRPDTNPNLRSKDVFWGTPLVTAVGRASTSIVKQLLDRSDIDPNQAALRTKPSGNPLFHAAGSGNHEITRLLLKRVDIDVNAATDNEVTPLVNAIQNNKIGIIKILLDHQNIDPNYAPENKTRIMQHFRMSDLSNYYFNTLSMSPIRSGIKMIPLFVAATMPTSEIFELLLGHPRIDINIMDKTCRTPLWWAASGGPKSNVQMLLEKGAGIDVNRKDIQGWTPLLVATNRQRLGVVGLLLDHPDIDPNIANHNGLTALHLSVVCNDLNITEKLLNHPRTNRALVTNDGMTALFIAQQLDHHRLAQILETNE